MSQDSPPYGDGPLVFISACEPSADLHAASLIRAMASIRPEVRFMGVAGPAMQAAGCQPIFDMTSHSAMLAGVFRVIPMALKLLASTKRHLKRYPVRAAVVVDSPTLNLPIALRAKRLGIPVLYFIAPQLWAWGKFRTRRVRRRVDKMAVILPFEEPFFRERGIDASYVGHPLIDKLSAESVDPAGVARLRSEGQPLIAILPGSRQHVVEENLPAQLAIAERISQKFPQARFAVSVANPTVRTFVETKARQCAVPIRLVEGGNAELLTAADLTLVTSGTATLEVAYRRCPMIVMYNASKWGYRLVGRWFISTPHLCLVNILAGRELVPEFMPYYTSIDPIAGKAIEMLNSPETLRTTAVNLDSLCRSLEATTGASANAARMLLGLLDDSCPNG